jgi:hypothetical protein
VEEGRRPRTEGIEEANDVASVGKSKVIWLYENIQASFDRGSGEGDEGQRGLKFESLAVP